MNKGGGMTVSTFFRKFKKRPLDYAVGGAAILGCVVSVGALFASPFAPAAALLLPAKTAGEVLISSLAAMTGLRAARKPDPESLAEHAGLAPRLEVELVTEVLRDRFRHAALAQITGLVAYMAIALPIGVIVNQIASDMPFASMMIVAAYAYAGLARFVRWDALIPPFRIEKTQAPAPAGAEDVEIAVGSQSL